jgi:hypothetical protein
VLHTACERLDARGWARLADRLARGDPHGQVAAAWQAKESTRDLYRARNTRHARRILAPLYAWAQTSSVPSRLARTLRGWQEPIIAWHTTGGASNGPTEAVNLLVNKSSAPATASATSRTTGWVASPSLSIVNTY